MIADDDRHRVVPQDPELDTSGRLGGGLGVAILACAAVLPITPLPAFSHEQEYDRATSTRPPLALATRHIRSSDEPKGQPRLWHR